MSQFCATLIFPLSCILAQTRMESQKTCYVYGHDYEYINMIIGYDFKVLECHLSCLFPSFLI